MSAPINGRSCCVALALLLQQLLLQEIEAIVLRGTHSADVPQHGQFSVEVSAAKAVAIIGTGLAATREKEASLISARDSSRVAGSVLERVGLPLLERIVVEDQDAGSPPDFLPTSDDDAASESTGFPGGMSELQYRHINDTHPIVWVFGSYHKTGCELAENIIKAFSGKHSVHWSGTLLNQNRMEIFSTKLFSNFYFNPNLQVINTLQHRRLVHFIRDPVSIIVSAYRFHCAGIEAWLHVPVKKAKAENEVLNDMQSLQKLAPYMKREHQDALVRFSESVDRGVSLASYFQDVPEEEGVIVEAYRSWPEIELLVKNYQKTLQDPRTLQLRMERITADFDGTMKCMLQFLARSRHLHIEQALKVLRKLDISRNPEAAGGGEGHVTTGKYDNTKILEVLESVGHVKWAQQALASPALNEC